MATRRNNWSYENLSEDQILLNSQNALSLLKECGFLITSHWNQLAGHLGVSLDDRKRLEMQAMTSQNYDLALEESLDLWIRGSVNRSDVSWRVLVDSVEKYELVTADRMRQLLHICKMSPLPHNHSLFPNVRSEMAAAVIQHHLEDLCLAIKDPTTIACQLFERRLIDNTSYQAAISPRSLQVGSVNVRTVQMLNAVYQMAVDKHRVDIISMFISILEGIGSTQPVAASMKRELDQVMMSPGTGSFASKENCVLDHYPDVPMKTEASPTPTMSKMQHSGSEDRIDVALTLDAEQMFDSMRMKFGFLLNKVCKSLSSKPLAIQDLKDQIVFSFCDLEGPIDSCLSVADVMKVLRKSDYCSFANCSIVDSLVQQFELQDVESDLVRYYNERDEYYKKILLEDFVLEAQEHIGRNRKVVFYVDWKKDDKSLAEFQQMLRAVFQGASKFIRLQRVKEGSLLLICECPLFVVGSIRRLVLERMEQLRRYGVLEVTVGETVVMPRKSSTSLNESTEDEVDNLNPKLRETEERPKKLQASAKVQEDIYTRKRSSSSDLLDIELLPDDLLPNQATEQSEPVFKTPNFSRAISFPTVLFHRQETEKPPAIPPKAAPKLPPKPLHLSASQTFSATNPKDIERSVSFSSESTFFSTAASFRPARTLSCSTSPSHTPLRKTMRSVSFHMDQETSSSLSSSPSLPLTETDSPDTETDTASTLYDETKFITVEDDDLRQYGWYWGHLSREETLDRLANTPDGTFLIRKSDSTSRQYLVSFRRRGNTKSMRVLWVNGRCGLGEATLFDTIPQLVEYFTLHPLPFKCNDSLVNLEYPQLRFESLLSSGSEYPIDMKKLLIEMQELSDQFEDQSDVYDHLIIQKKNSKKKLDESKVALMGFKNLLDLLTKQLEELESHEMKNMSTHSLNMMTTSFNLLKKKIHETQVQYNLGVSKEAENRREYQNFEEKSNTLRAELVQMRREKDFLTSQLMNEGLTRDEVYQVIKMRIVNELEDTYVALYKQRLSHGQDDARNTTVYDYAYVERPHMRKNTQHMYDYPMVLPRKKAQSPVEPFYHTVDPLVHSPPTSFPAQLHSTFSTSSPEIALLGVSKEKPPPIPERVTSPKRKSLSFSSSWYIETNSVNADRMLANRCDGTFLCIPADRQTLKEGGVHVYTVHVIHKKAITHLKVIKHNGYFGFALPCIFNSLYDLILHHSTTNLTMYDSKLSTSLIHPIS